MRSWGQNFQIIFFITLIVSVHMECSRSLSQNTHTHALARAHTHTLTLTHRYTYRFITKSSGCGEIRYRPPLLRLRTYMSLISRVADVNGLSTRVILMLYKYDIDNSLGRIDHSVNSVRIPEVPLRKGEVDAL